MPIPAAIIPIFPDLSPVGRVITMVGTGVGRGNGWQLVGTPPGKGRLLHVGTLAGFWVGTTDGVSGVTGGGVGRSTVGDDVGD
jgi:hypothetical protein